MCSVGGVRTNKLHDRLAAAAGPGATHPLHCLDLNQDSRHPHVDVSKTFLGVIVRQDDDVGAARDSVYLGHNLTMMLKRVSHSQRVDVLSEKDTAVLTITDVIGSYAKKLQEIDDVRIGRLLEGAQFIVAQGMIWLRPLESPRRASFRESAVM